MSKCQATQLSARLPPLRCSRAVTTWQHARVNHYRANKPGVLPPDGSPTIGGFTLSAGRRFTPPGAGEPVLWLTNETPGPYLGRPPSVDLYAGLRRQFTTSGLWPLLVCRERQNETEEEWLADQLDPRAASNPDAVDVLSLLAPVYAEEIGSDWPPWVYATLPSELNRLAEPVAGDYDESYIEDLVDNRYMNRLALVPVTRPADVLLVLGWQGAQHRHCHYDPGQVTAVLRGLEDRFGAMPVTLRPGAFELAAQRPPTSQDQIRLLAAEATAFAYRLGAEAYDEEAFDITSEASAHRGGCSGGTVFDSLRPHTPESVLSTHVGHAAT